MQQVTVKQKGARYIAVASFEQRHIPKGAGFRWDAAARCWFTLDPDVAARIASPGAVKAVVDRVFAAQEAKVAAIALSRAEDFAGELPCPKGLAYLPYQRAGIHFASTREATLFGDEMGLGKTIQAIGVLNTDQTLRRILIVCPASLKMNWQRELRKWLTRELSVLIVDSSWWPSGFDINIINYDILAKYHERLRSEEWDCIVIDEAHYLKNPQAKRTKALLGSRKTREADEVRPVTARRRIAMTGTPIPNRPIEVQPILQWLDPRDRHWSFFTFAKLFAGASKGAFGWDFSGASNLEGLQEAMRSSVMIRRKKADVLKDLPAKRRAIVLLEATGACAEFVDGENELWDANEARMEALRVRVELAKASDDPDEYTVAVAALSAAAKVAFTEMSELRHRTAVAKVPQVIEHITTALETEGHKLVVFAHHKDVIAAIMDALEAAEIKAVKVTGDDGMMERDRAVMTFQNDPGTRVFVGNIQAAGVGLTLTAAAHVVFAELDWVPGNVTQAEDRCHRYGQRDSVLCQHLVLDGSLDSKMAATLIAKQEIADQALDRIAEKGAPEPEMPVLPLKAATESIKKAEIEARAALVTPEGRATVHRGLALLSGLDGDYARSLNGVGFSRMDVQIGHSLAERLLLTPKQAVLGAQLVRKYRKQLPDEIVAAALAILA